MIFLALYRHRFQWMFSMAGSAAAMRWVTFDTLCIAFRSKAEPLPYQTVMQLVRMLSMVQRWRFTRMSEDTWFFLWVLRKKRCWWAFLASLAQTVIQVKFSEMRAPRKLKLFKFSTTLPLMWIDGCGSAFLLKFTMSSLVFSVLSNRLLVSHHSARRATPSL